MSGRLRFRLAHLLVVFHTISEGIRGECDRHGGYSALGGQVGIDCMVRPPCPGDTNYAPWKSETDARHTARAAHQDDDSTPPFRPCSIYPDLGPAGYDYLLKDPGRKRGLGYERVRVRVPMKMIWGYPCRTLVVMKDEW